MDTNSQTINEISADATLVAALQAWIPALNTNRVALGMTTQQVTDLTTVCNTYISGVTAVVAAKNAAKAAVSNKDAVKSTARAQISTWTKTWRANPAIPDSLLATMQTAPHNPEGTSTPPVTPTNLVATANAEGMVTLRWKRAGNKSGTLFIVETRDSASEPWVMAGFSTKLKYQFQATAGSYVAFRVIAARAGQMSAATAPVSLWDNGDTVSLQVAA